MSMVPHILGENETQKMCKEQRKAKRKLTKDGRMQLRWNIYKRLKIEEFDEPNDDNEASDPSFLTKKGKGVVVSVAKSAKKGLNVNAITLKQQYKRKNLSKNSRKKRKTPCRIRVRSSPGSFSLLMCMLNDDQKAALREMGFMSMLDFEIDKIPTVMGYWALKNFDYKACTLQVRDASLKVTKETIHDVLGVPTGGTRINPSKITCSTDLVTKEFRKQFPATKNRINVTDVIGEMVKQEKAGRLFKLNFLVLFVTVMVEGIKNGAVNQQFLTCIKKLEDVRNMDWCEYILESLVRTRKGWDENGHYNGPLAFLVVFYANSINPRNLEKETSVPVINTWTSDMLLKLEEKEFNTGHIMESGIRKLVAMELKELKDRRTSFKKKRRKHNILESCNTKFLEYANNNKEAPENVSDGDLNVENDVVESDDGELNRDNTQKMVEELCSPHVEGLYNKYDGWVLSSGQPKEPMTEEPGHQLPTKASTSHCSIICVQGYEVKEHVAPILEAIFKKHGDIAAKCVLTIASVRASLLEVVCEVVRRIQANDVIEKMEEIESHLSQAEALKIDVSWLRVHLEDIYKKKDVMKKWSLLMETKVKTVLVQRAAQMDLRERCAELVTAQERFEEAEKCVRVLHLVEKNLNNNILESKADKDSWGIANLLG